MYRHDRLRKVLQDAEEHAPPMQLDQIAFVLASLARAGVVIDVVALPKLQAQVLDCAKDLEGHYRPSRSSIIGAGGLDIDNPPRDSSKNLPLVLLGLSDWRDRDDRVGRVVDLLVKEYA